MKKLLLNLYKRSRKNLSFLKSFRLVKNIDMALAEKLRRNINFPVETENGYKMYIDPMDTHHLSTNGVFDRFETELCRKLIKKNDVVLDIGASIGYYTLLFSKLANGDGGRVFAFEPDPVTFRLLKMNVRLNNCKNVVLSRQAVSKETGTTRLYFHDNDRADDRIYYNPYDRRKSIKIKTTSLDDYFEGMLPCKVDFIKMDVQGAELFVLLGMKRLIKDNPNLKIMTEFWPEGLEQAGVKPEDYLKILLKYGFKIYLIDEQAQRLMRMPMDYYLGLKGYVNLLCVRGKKDVRNMPKMAKSLKRGLKYSQNQKQS